MQNHLDIKRYHHKKRYKLDPLWWAKLEKILYDRHQVRRGFETCGGGSKRDAEVCVFRCSQYDNVFWMYSMKNGYVIKINYWCKN